MKIQEIEYHGCLNCLQEWLPENTIEIEKQRLSFIVEKISRNGQCRFPLLAIRILIYAITSIDSAGRFYISARQLSKSLDVNYDTVTKCLKYLREIDVLQFDK